jgi:hypothetical protein
MLDMIPLRRDFFCPWIQRLFLTATTPYTASVRTSAIGPMITRLMNPSESYRGRLGMWNFDQPPNCATVMSNSIVQDGQAILLVSHDEDDQGWQCLEGSSPPSEPLMVCLNHAVNLASSVHQLANLAAGWIAWRETVDSPWVRQQHDPANEYERDLRRPWLTAAWFDSGRLRQSKSFRNSKSTAESAACHDRPASPASQCTPKCRVISRPAACRSIDSPRFVQPNECLGRARILDSTRYFSRRPHDPASAGFVRARGCSLRR